MEKTSEIPKKPIQTQIGSGGDANRQDRKGSEKVLNSHVTEQTSSKGPELSTISSTPAASIASQTEQKLTPGSRNWTLDPSINETNPWSLNM
jgi:hypothetical protein